MDGKERSKSCGRCQPLYIYITVKEIMHYNESTYYENNIMQ